MVPLNLLVCIIQSKCKAFTQGCMDSEMACNILHVALMQQGAKHTQVVPRDLCIWVYLLHYPPPHVSAAAAAAQIMDFLITVPKSIYNLLQISFGTNSSSAYCRISGKGPLSVLPHPIAATIFPGFKAAFVVGRFAKTYVGRFPRFSAPIFLPQRTYIN